MEISLLSDIVIVLGLSVLIILLFQKIKVPPIIGFLLTGIVVGPHGLNVLQASHEVELMSEIGVILLLFVIGIEFSLKGLISIKNTVLWGGFLQVGGTILFTSLIMSLFGLSWSSAVFVGFLVSLSSTAIVLKMLQERGEISSPHGRVSVALLIFQDIIVVPMMLITPILAGKAEDPLMSTLILIGKVVLVVGLVILLARYVVPYILKKVVHTKSRELFILTVVVMCFATAWLTASIGLSLALGAFFAGLIISESEYSHQATANILPFREIFISFFFVSIGMLLNVKFFISHFWSIHLVAVGAMLLKLLIVSATVLILKYPPRTIILSALALFQVGEFAFVLLSTGMENELLSPDVYQYFLAVSIISMGATPFVLGNSAYLTELLLRAPLPRKVKRRMKKITKKNARTMHHSEDDFHDHLVIIGYGINGQNVAQAARAADISHVIVDLDPAAIELAKSRKEPVVYGDATDETILQHVRIHESRVVVVAISSPIATKQIVQNIRRFTETAHVIVRTRYVREVEENYKVGASDVIPEEFETSIEIFTRVLNKYMIPRDEIQQFTNFIRAHNYEMLREMGDGGLQVANGIVHIPDLEVATITVRQGNNAVVGRKLGDTDLRNVFGISVLAIKRDKKYITNVGPETTIEQDDILYILGTPENVMRVNQFCKMFS